MLCPRCEQGEIAKASVRKTGVRLFVCQECEAAWFSPDEIGAVPFVDFGTYMEEQELPPLWEELVIEGT